MGPRSEQLEALLRRVCGDAHGTGSPAAGSTVSTAPTVVAAPVLAAANRDVPPPPPGALTLPPRRVSALLVLVFLGFGVLLGNVAGSRVQDTLASTRSPMKVVLPATGSSSTTTSSSTASESTASESSSEPPASESEPTPAPAPSNTATKTQSSSSAGSTGSESGSESGASGGSQGGSSESAASQPAKKLPPIKHVFVIMLSDAPYASVFGPSSTAPYLSGTLEHKGELLVRYDAVAHDELANEVALLSGQGPTAETAANCPSYSEIASASKGPEEQVLGNGCVYPSSTQTLAGQLSAKHLTWRAYVQGIDEVGSQAGACAHPTLGQPDPTADEASSSGPYATFRNPFVYFDSVLDSPQCAADDVGLGALKGDLASAKSTPSFAYLAPDRCHDANPTPCTPGAPAGPAQADSFLKEVVPEITGSKAYKEGGLLVITTDQAPSSGEFADSSSCCGQPLFPNVPSKTLTGAPRGGGAVGALLLSPYVKAGTTSQEKFNHFSLLRTIEDLFALKHLGYAALPAVKSFEPSMFTAGKS